MDTIFEIGGQDSKFIRIDDGVVVDFTMNEACAAGTGSFLEEQAEKLGISIKGEFAQMALASTKPARLGERCTVFMERDVTSLLLKGAEVGDLAAGLAYSVALNYLNRVVRGRKIGDVIFFQGGTAYNDAVAAAFSQILGKRIIVPPHNGVIGAIGMALIARERMQQRGRPASKFRGYHLDRVDYKTREFVCKACSNFCDIKEFNIEGQRTYWGDKCSDKFRKRARTDRKPVVEDLVEYRDKVLEQVLKPPAGNRKKVGIPRTMFFYDKFPFWCAYIQELGFDVVVSPRTDPVIAASGDELAIAQPCFPVKVAHGHVQKLLESGVDYVLLPNALNEYTEQPTDESHLCPWNQTLPFVVRAIPQMEAARGKFLAPTVNFRYGRKHVEKELAEFAKTLGISRRMSDRAVTAAYAAQGAFTDQLTGKPGAHALRELERTGEPALVLVGRSYNLYDRSINCDIPRKLRAQYGVNVIPMDFLPLEAGGHHRREPEHVLELRTPDPGRGAHHPPPPQSARGVHLEFQVRPRFLHQVVHGRRRRKTRPGAAVRRTLQRRRLHHPLRSLSRQQRIPAMLAVRHRHLSRKISAATSAGRQEGLHPRHGAGQRGGVCAACSAGWASTPHPTPPSNERTRELGAKHTAATSVIPAKVTVGDFLRIIEQPGFDPRQHRVLHGHRRRPLPLRPVRAVPAQAAARGRLPRRAGPFAHQQERLRRPRRRRRTLPAHLVARAGSRRPAAQGAAEDASLRNQRRRRRPRLRRIARRPVHHHREQLRRHQVPAQADGGLDGRAPATASAAFPPVTTATCR